MKKALLLSTLLLFSTSNLAMADEFTVTVDGIEPQRGGTINVLLFEKTGFPKSHQKAIYAVTKAVDNSSMTFEFDVDISEFAVKVWHDEDENGVVTKNWTGVAPKEGLGFTNGQRITSNGQPRYSRTKINTSQTEGHVNIPIAYP